jgi:hypothetical protein
MAKVSLSEKVLALLQARRTECSMRQIVYFLKAYGQQKGVLTSLNKLEASGKIVCTHCDITPFTGNINSKYRAVSQQQIDDDWEDLLNQEPIDVIFRNDEHVVRADDVLSSRQRSLF